MDSNIQSLDLLRSFILKLTDADIYEIDEISLTSGQKARIASWCEDNNIDIPDLNNTKFWKNGILEKQINPNLAINNFSKTKDILVGIDIQQIDEFMPDVTEVTKNDKNLNSIFTKRELSYAESKINSNLVSKSINLIGKNKFINSFLKKFADHGLRI